MKETLVTRRRLLKAGGALAGLSCLPLFGRPGYSAASATMALVAPYTGALAFAGPLLERGARLAISRANGAVAGHEINFITRDTETKPGVGARRATEVIASEGAVFFAGNYSSSVGLAMAEVAKQNKVVQYAGGGSEDFTGARCNRYTFQWSASPYTALKATMDYMRKAAPDVKRVYTFTVDYIFGETLLKYAKLVGEDYGLEFVGNDYHKIGERNFNQFLTKVVAAEPDALMLLNFGGDALASIRQFNNFGLQKKVRVVGPWAMEVDQMRELAPAMRAGLILGQNYYHTIDTPENRAFVAAYQAQYNEPPTYAAAYGYDTFRTVMLAMEAAGSIKPQDVVPALEGMKFGGVLGGCSIDPATHQTVRPYFVVEGKPEDQMNSETDYADVMFEGSDNQPKHLNGCKDIGAL